MAGGRKLRVSCGPVATFNPSKQEAKEGSDEAQDSIVLSMSNELLYLVPELHTHTTVLQQLMSANLALIPCQMPCSQQPTRSSRRLGPKSLQPSRALLDHLGLPTNHSLGIIVGLMATASVSITQVQHAVARPRATRTWQRPPTRWEVATPTKDGTHVAPDSVGGQI